jgi:outer membrane lipoprotein carrier protein
MKKIIIACLFFSGLLMNARAQNNSLGKNDPDAKKILDQVSAKIKSFKSVQATFTLSIEDSKGKSQGVKKGTFYQKGSQYHISITGQEIFSDGKTSWSYDKSTNEVTITKVDQTVKTVTPEKFFTDFYDKDFLYKLNGNVKQGTKDLQEIELTPTDKTKTFFKVLLYIDSKTKTMYSMKSLEKNGTKYTLTINSLNGTSVISDSQLVFDKSKYPGVDEVDLRN